MLPTGTATVGGGLLINGLATYGFLVVAARALGPEAYAPLAVLWSLAFTLGPGIFLPLEQETARVTAACRSAGTDDAGAIRAIAQVGGVLALGIVIVAGLALPPLAGRLFDGHVGLVVALVVTVVGYGVLHLGRGILAGRGRYAAYGQVVGAEGVIRVVVAVVLLAVGVSASPPYGFAIAIAPFLAVGLAWRRGWPSIVGGDPDRGWRQVSSALLWLLVASLMAQALANGSQVAVKLLVPADESARASRFLASLVVARVPLFLFAAVQAALVPQLATLVARGDRAAFRRTQRRLLSVVAGLSFVATVAAVAVGPWVVRVFFGDAFDLARFDMLLLGVGTGAYLLGVSIAQAVIALRSYVDLAMAWSIGLVAFLLALAVPLDALRRVEVASIIGSSVMALLMLILERRSQSRMRWAAA